MFAEGEDVEGETAFAAAVTKMTPDEAHDYALVTAARIEEDIKWKGQVWEDFSKEERLVAASASPTALLAELESQIRETMSDEPEEYAYKAAVKRKKSLRLPRRPSRKTNLS